MSINNTIHKIEFSPKRRIIFGGRLTVDDDIKTVDAISETTDMNAIKHIL